MTRQTQLHLQRNFGIIAHVDAGKTTLTERILHITGRTRATGEVHDGNTVTDFDTSERAHGITISAASVQCRWQDHRLELIDTPGHVDFAIEVERSLRVLDGAVVVLDGVAGIEAQTETVWRQADRHNVPRICFVNKLDRLGASYDAVANAIEKRFGKPVASLTMPFEEDGQFIGVVDLIHQRVLTWDDAGTLDVQALNTERHHHMLEAVKVARDSLMEVCGILDDDCAERYLETDNIPAADMLRVLRKATLANTAIVTLCGSAFKHRGIEPLLDAIITLLPSPADRPAVTSVDGNITRAPDPEGPLAALCFNVKHDHFGKVASVRVYSGQLRKGMKVHCSRTGRQLRVGRLLRVFANHREDIDCISTGEIGAVVGLDATTGDTLSDVTQPLCLESIEVPPAVVRLAVEPLHRTDQDRLGMALSRLAATDPSLRLETNAETGQTILAGLGELHLSIVMERLAQAEVKVKATRPRVSYREALTRTVEQEFTLSKQTGGPGMYAKIKIRVAPAEPGAGLVFTDALRGEELPRHYLRAIEDGVRLAMTSGPVGGYPLPDVSVVVLGGGAHSKDSSDMAFQTAAAKCFRLAAPRAAPTLLEPFMRLAISAPNAFVGAITGDVGRRRGRVLALVAHQHERTLNAEAPLAELFGYAASLSSLTSGRGSFTMEFDSYRAASASVTSDLLAACG